MDLPVLKRHILHFVPTIFYPKQGSLLMVNVLIQSSDVELKAINGNKAS
jgi:hypothetical protein